MPVVTYRGIDKAIDHLISRVKGWFVALETSPSTSDLVEIRLQDLEELADRFITWYTNIVSRPYGDAFHHRSLEDSPELLGAVQEALQSINEDLMEVQSYQKHDSDGIRTSRPELDDTSNNARPEPLDEEAVDMILADLNEAVTGLMRLTKPINDFYLLGAQCNVEWSTRKDCEAEILSELGETFSEIPGFLLERLTQSISERRDELLTVIKRKHGVSTGDDEQETVYDVYRSVKSVLERKPDKSLWNLDSASPDEGSISSVAAGSCIETETRCHLCSTWVTWSNELMLRKHYYQDIGVYICVLEGCPIPHVRYGTRTAWAEHLRFQHGRTWRCAFGCEQIFASRHLFDTHMRGVHHEKFAESELSRLAEVCEKHTLPTTTTKCAFCQATSGNARAHYRHIARHLEDLATLSFPGLGGQPEEQDSNLSRHEVRFEASSLSEQSRSQRRIEMNTSTVDVPELRASANDGQLSRDSQNWRANSDDEKSASESDSSGGSHQAERIGSFDLACAICAAPSYSGCGHEDERLQIALSQAQEKCVAVQKIRDWARNHARDYVIKTFERERARRLDVHRRSLKALPYYSFYKDQERHPSLSSQQLQMLQDRVSNADATLKTQVDTAWRNACLMYPRVLQYYFHLVSVEFPNSHDVRLSRPQLTHQKWYESRALQSASNPFALAYGRSSMPTLQSDPVWRDPQSTSSFGDHPPTHDPGHRDPFTPPPSTHNSSLYSPGPVSIVSGPEPAPSSYGYPSMAGIPPYMTQPVRSPPPHPPTTNEGRDRVKKSGAQRENGALAKEVEKLRALIKQQEEERIAREYAIEAEARAKKSKAEQEALKAEEIAAAVAAGKAQVELDAKDAAIKAKEESDKRFAEVEAARLDLEKKDNSMVKELEAIRDLLRQQGAARAGARTRKRLKLPTWIKA